VETERKEIISSQKLKNFYIWGIKILIFLIPFLPLYVSPSMVFEYITGRNFAFRIITELAVVLWLGLITLNKEYRPKTSTMLLVVLIFTFVVGLADLLGVNPYNSFWSSYERMEGYITILHLVLYFLVIKSVLKTKKEWMFFFNLFVIASVLVSLYALFQKFNILSWVKEYESSAFRVYSTIGSPTFLASYLLFTIFIGLILTVNTRKFYLKGLYIFIILINYLVIYYTGTRGAVLASITGAVLFSFFYLFRKEKTPKDQFIKKLVIPVLGIFIILSILFWPVRGSNIQKDKSLSHYLSILEYPSVQYRFWIWQAAWAGIKERPFLGWGQENFTSIYTAVLVPFPFYFFSPFIYSAPLWTDRAHNIILDWLINAGVIGLFSYLAIFFSAFYVIRRSINKYLITKSEGFIIFTAFIVYFTQNLFIFDSINTYIFFFTLLAYVDKLDYKSENSCYFILKKSKIAAIVFTIIALLVFFVCTYFVNYKPIKQAQISNKINSYDLKSTSFLTLLGDFKRALSFKTFGDTELRVRMAEICEKIFRYKLYKDSGAMIFLQSSIEEIEKLVVSNPHNLSYWLYLIDICNKISFYEPSFISITEDLIKKFISLSPENQWMVSFMQADNFVLKKDYENAFLTIKKAAKLAPQSDTIQLRLALAGILTSREDVIDSALDIVKKIRKKRNENIANDKANLLSIDELILLARTCIEVKNIKRAQEFLKDAVSIAPDEARYHFEIAEIYLAIGDKTNAIKEAKKAAKLDPTRYSEKTKDLIDSF
jgi:O-antigen ligase